MIQLVDRGLNESSIRFTPRSRYRHLGPVECELISGYKCNHCSNVVQAFFATNKAIDLDKYEETIVRSQGEKNHGEILKIIPNLEDLDGNYRTEFFATPNGNAMRITLKNHVLNLAGCIDRERFFEKGERCCEYTALICMQSQDVALELAVVAGYDIYTTERITKTTPDLPWIQGWLKSSVSWENMRVQSLPSIGQAPDGLLIRREMVKNPFVSVPNHMFTAWDKHLEAQALTAA
jgi:hypothetical protein